VYVADTANFPYGTKNEQDLIIILENLVEKLLEYYSPSILVLACNTASVVGLEHLRKKFPSLPMVGTVPAVKPAALGSKTRSIGILATTRTLEDPYILELKEKFGPDCRLFPMALDKLVKVVEEGQFLCPEGKRIIEDVSEEARKLFLEAQVDQAVLGCTHFLHVQTELQAIFGPSVQLVDSLEGVAKRVESLLENLPTPEYPTEPFGKSSTLVLTGSGPLSLVYKKYVDEGLLTPEVWKGTQEKLAFEGQVIWGANNIFMILGADGVVRESRLKGKILKLDDEPHNPLSPGDWVALDPFGQIIQRSPRRNAFHRWNNKRSSLQTLAANVDQVLILGCVGIPPFRPRFLDRAIIACVYDDVPFVIGINKIELEMGIEEKERILHYKQLGYPVFMFSLHTKEGTEALISQLKNRTTAFIGQSGVGKSSLLKFLSPEVVTKIGDISEKYQRGRHTTTLSRMYFTKIDSTRYIDTPGVRELDLSFLEPEQLGFYFPEFEEHRWNCAMTSCTHEHEPGCQVEKAFEEGKIHEDRYESYLRILQEIRFARKGRYNR